MKSGFTLIETIVAIAISTLVMLAIASLIIYFYRNNASAIAGWEAVGHDREGIEQAMMTLREASQITAASASSISFIASGESLNYVAQNGELDETGDATSTIATSFANSLSAPVFTFYDANGAQLSDPVDPSSVRTIELEAIIQADPPASATTIFAGAAPRNLP